MLSDDVPTHRSPRSRAVLADAALDLLLGGRCVGCARPGRLLCAACAATLPDAPFRARLVPPPPGLVEAWAAADYEGLVRALVLGHKERRLLGLRRPLGALLGAALDAALGSTGADPLEPVLLVPVPSRASSTRSRGHDPTRALVDVAAATLRGRGRAVDTAPLLRLRPGVVDQAGLDARQRAANLAGSMTCPSPRLRRAARRAGPARVVVCDDVLTTGATVREAQRALEAVGVQIAAVSAVAATRRRTAAVATASAGGTGPG